MKLKIGDRVIVRWWEESTGLATVVQISPDYIQIQWESNNVISSISKRNAVFMVAKFCG